MAGERSPKGFEESGRSTGLDAPTPVISTRAGSPPAWSEAAIFSAFDFDRLKSEVTARRAPPH